MLTEFISGIFGLVGVVIGSFIPIIYQVIQDRRKEKKENREINIEKMHIITKRLNSTEWIINIFIDFLDADYDDHEHDPYREANFGRLCEIYNEEYIYFWDEIITELYLVLPNSTKTEYFRILNNFMRETKDISEKINEYLEDEGLSFDKIKELQMSFEHNRSKYITALYAKILLLEELQNNIECRNVNLMSKAYYKKNKNHILSTIQHCNKNKN
jgi:hypothetical protein